MVVAKSNPDIIIASVVNETTETSAIVMSKNGGKTWDTANTGLPRLDDRRTTCLTFGSGVFYAGTDQGDLFELNNSEGRWNIIAANLDPIRDIAVLS